MDRELVEAAQRGDRSAYVDRAEDAFQDALVIAWRDLRSLRDPDRLDAWLQRLFVHVCLEPVVESGVDLAACDPPIGLQVWLDAAGNYLIVGPEVVTRIYLVDTPGGRLVLVANHGQSADPGEIAEVDAMIASIRFEP